MIGKPTRKHEVAINKRGDGRHEVTVDGYVRWCGWSVEHAGLLAGSLARRLRPPTPIDDAMLGRAIDRTGLSAP